ncbi:MAG: hypothetical protein ACYC1E_01965 [Propionibacteriaceae bacterium]
MPTTPTPCPVPGAQLRRPGQVRLLPRGCWVEEAIVNGSLDFPPLAETFDEVPAWMDATGAKSLRNISLYERAGYRRMPTVRPRPASGWTRRSRAD